MPKCGRQTNILDQFDAKNKKTKQKEIFLNDKSSMATNLILNLITKLKKQGVCSSIVLHLFSMHEGLDSFPNTIKWINK